MKHLISIGIITAVCFAGELLYFLLPLPIPASIYGLLLMLILLLTGVVKVHQVELTSNFFLTIMPLLFLEPAVKLMTSLPTLKGNLISILFLCLVSTIVVTAVTGMTAEKICTLKKVTDQDNIPKIKKNKKHKSAKKYQKNNTVKAKENGHEY